MRRKPAKERLMPVDAKTRAALKLKNLNLPPKPRVLTIKAEDYVNWDGEEALKIWVVINKNTTNKELQNGKALLQITGAIHDALLAKWSVSELTPGLANVSYLLLDNPFRLQALEEVRQLPAVEFPVERAGLAVGQRLVQPQTLLDLRQADKVVGRQDLPLDDREVNLHLVQPTGMDRRVNQNGPGGRLGQAADRRLP